MNFKHLNEAFDRLNEKALNEVEFSKSVKNNPLREYTSEEKYLVDMVRDTFIDAHIDYESIDVTRKGNYILISVYNDLPYTTDDLYTVWLNMNIPEAESCDMLNDGSVMMFEFSLNGDTFEESLSDDIRKGNLDYDDEIDAHYKKNGNVEVQFQDRNSNMHVQRNPKDRFSKFEKQPRVSSHTWGRVWKDGNLVKSVEDSKYGTRQEIARYLDDNELGESLTEDTSKEWKPNTSFAHIKKVYNDVKNRDYKYVNNEREEMQAAMKKVDAKGYTPEQRKQIRSWHEEIWRAHKKNESLKESYDDVNSNNAFDVLYDMVELFGCEEMLNALARAMGTDDLADNLTYICRQYDYDPNPDSVDESLTEERGNYGHKGPFWYYSKHGMGPGTIPKDVNVVDWYEDDNYNTWIALDGVLTTQELREYGLKEQKPPIKDR